MAAFRGLWRTCSLLSSQSPLFLTAIRAQCSASRQVVPRTSLSSPPWPELKPLLPEEVEEEKRRHAAVVSTVNQLIQGQDFGRLFAVVFLAGHQWKVTAEDLILVETHIDAECGERIRLEKVLLAGADEFTLIGKPLLGKELVRVEATVVEKTESCPKVVMRFLKRKRFQRKRFVTHPQTVLRINSIELAPTLTK